MNSFKEAKRLHGLGFAIHWLYPKAKNPIGKGWAAGDRKIWEDLSQTYTKEYNVGVRLGTPSKIGNGYLAVIDVDIKSKDERHCKEAYSAAMDLIGKAKCPMVLSGRGNGSCHYYFLTEKPFKTFNSAVSTEKVKVHMPSKAPSKAELKELTQKEISDGIRIANAWEVSLYSEGRQAVLPPSIHPDSGNQYIWKIPLTDISSLPYLALALPIAIDKPDKKKKDKLPLNFKMQKVDLNAKGLSERIKNMINYGEDNGEVITDFSNAIFSVALAMCSAGFTNDEVISVLIDRENALGPVSYRHAKSENPLKAAAWIKKYTVEKARATIDAPKGASPKQNAEQRYFEQSSYLLKKEWGDRFQIVIDTSGNKVILEKRSNNILQKVVEALLISDATKLFYGTTLLRRPSRVKDAIENFLNLSESLENMPYSILLADDPEIAFERLDFLPKKASTPLFDELMSRCSNANALMAFVYSLFVPQADRQQYVWLYGDGGDGKGALARFLRKCIKSAYHAERAGGASNNKHFTAGFVGKRLAVFSDSNATKFVTSEIFKELSGGDPIKVEFKYENSFTTSLDTKFLFISNSMPVIGSQKSDQRRIILSHILPIRGEVDPEYERNLWEEREGILYKCEKAYSSLTKKHGPIQCDRVAAMDLAGDWEVRLRIIFEGTFILDKNGSITPEEFYKSSRLICEEHNVQFDEFKNWAVRTYGLNLQRNVANGNKRMICGLTIRAAFSPSNFENFNNFENQLEPVIREKDFNA